MSILLSREVDGVKDGKASMEDEFDEREDIFQKWSEWRRAEWMQVWKKTNNSKCAKKPLDYLLQTKPNLENDVLPK